MRLIAWPALISGSIPPIVITMTWLIAQSTWPEYDWMEQPISDLAADDAPTQVYVTIAFVVAGTANIVTAFFARSFAPAARIAFVLNGLFTFGLAYFTTPSQTSSSEEHRIFAVSAFAISAVWPLLATRINKNYSILIRLPGTLTASIVLTTVTTILLVIWVDSDASGIGVLQRLVGMAQGIYPAFVIWWCWFHQRRMFSNSKKQFQVGRSVT